MHTPCRPAPVGPMGTVIDRRQLQGQSSVVGPDAFIRIAGPERWFEGRCFQVGWFGAC
ncbi:hypothetical protein [Novacetimonas hansenii]|uniref:Uncharacterized protein n=1 Tax=Novacetimonas hansenii TaxID=436 RepID=A0AAW5EL01_NOVHA|nr:hypothetical protein [Novacetimonas hansenii]MCJ8352454.1 hypothetical protein [Novacetimonas hansenii]